MIYFSELELGMEVSVSDGSSEPPDPENLDHRVWRSRNFTGTVCRIDETGVGIEVDNGMCVVEWSLRNGDGLVFTPTEPTDAVLERTLHAQIDTEAGEFRKQFITDVPGQQASYQMKEAEARSWNAEADQTKFPFLSGEAAARGITLEDMADMVVSISNTWTALAATIEVARISAKVAVTAAEGREAKEAAAVVDWPGILG